MIDRDADRAVYRQIADLLADEIRAGRWRPGHQLPGEDALAQRFEVARSTVHKALVVLREAGLVILRKGFRPMVRGESAAHVVRLSRGSVAARAAEPREARRLGIAAGSPVLVVRRGDVQVVLPADRVTVEIVACTHSG